MAERLCCMTQDPRVKGLSLVSATLIFAILIASLRNAFASLDSGVQMGICEGSLWMCEWKDMSSIWQLGLYALWRADLEGYVWYDQKSPMKKG